jgi:hypothetical protein
MILNIKESPLFKYLNFITQNVRLTFASIFILVFLLYGITVSGGYNLDDELVTINHRLTSKGIEAIPEIFSSNYYEDEMGYSYEYRPIVLSSFAIEHSIFGESPGISHLINVLIYAFTCLLIFFLSKKIFHAKSELFAAFVTVLFIIHPMHTEAVAGIKNRDELLSLAGGLLSFWFSIKYFNKDNIAFLLLSGIFLTLGLLSKLSAFSFLVIIPFWLVINKAPIKQLLAIIYLFIIISSFIFKILKFNSIHIIQYNVCLCLLIGLFYLLTQLYRQRTYIKEKIDKFSFSFLRFNNELKTNDYYLLGIAVLGIVLSFNSNLPWALLPFFITVFSVLFLKGTNNIFYLLVLGLYVSLIEYFSISIHIKLLFFLLFYTSIQASQLPILNRYILLFSVLLLFITGNILSGSDWIDTDITLPLIFIVFEIIAQKIKLKSFYKILFWIFFIVLTVSIAVFVNHKLSTAILIFPLMVIFYEIYNVEKVSVTIVLFITVFFSLNCFEISSPFKKIYFFGNNENKYEYSTAESVDSKTQTTLQENTYKDRPLNFIEYPLGLKAALSEKAGTASGVLAKYLSMMIVPYPMKFYYGFNEIKIINVLHPLSIISFLLHLVFIISALLLLNKHPILSFGILSYLVSIVLFSNFLYPVAGMYADRLTYVASFGYCIALGYLFYHLFIIASTSKRIVLMSALFLIIVIYSGLTIIRNSQWKDHLTLMRHDIQFLKNSAQANNLLAFRLVEYSNTIENKSETSLLRQEAIMHFRNAIKIYPDFLNAWYDLGRTYLLLSDLDNAYPCFKKVHELDSTFSEATLNIALIAEEKNDYNTAIYYYTRLININPNIKEGYTNLSYLLYRMNKPIESIEVNKKAIEINPGWSDPYENIAKVYFAINDTAQANKYYYEALKRKK